MESEMATGEGDCTTMNEQIKHWAAVLRLYVRIFVIPAALWWLLGYIVFWSK